MQSSSRNRHIHRTAGSSLIVWLAWSLLPLACASSDARKAEQGEALEAVAVRDDSSPESLNYRLQRGDEIEIRVFQIPELDQVTRVRPDGKISVAVIDEIEAVDRTPSELAEELAGALGEHFDEPVISVIVVEFATQNIYVGGEVRLPGLVPLRNRMNTVAAALAAGGYRDSAELSNIIVLRDAGGHPEIITLDVKKILASEANDILLHPYDIVYVPKSTIAKVNLFVEQYITKVLPVNLQGAVNYNFLGGL